MARAKGLISNQGDSHGNFLAVAFITVLMLGCQTARVQNPTRVSSPTPTISPSSTASPSPTNSDIPPTPVLSPTNTGIPPTPGPDLVLEGSPSAVSYTIPLNIQHLTKNDATLYFEIQSPTDGFLFYWQSGSHPSQGRWIEFGDESTRHLIPLQDLEQDVIYFAAVGLLGGEGSYHLPAFGEDAWDPIRVHPFDMQEGVVRIGVIGDTGFGDQVTKNLAAQILNQDIDMLIHTGDLVYLAEDHATPQAAFAAKFYEAFTGLLHEIPIYPVIGNHEYDSAVTWMDLPYYAHAFPPLPLPAESQIDSEDFRQYYALEIGSLQFLFLDSQAFWVGAGSDDQNIWLAQRLENNQYTATIVIFHVAPYTSGLHRDDGKILRQEWVPLFEQSNVIMVITGHDHNYERLQANGITYLVSGGGSAVLYGLRAQLAASEIFTPRSHFLLLTLRKDGLNVTAMDADGTILDTFELQFSL